MSNTPRRKTTKQLRKRKLSATPLVVYSKKLNLHRLLLCAVLTVLMQETSAVDGLTPEELRKIEEAAKPVTIQFRKKQGSDRTKDIWEWRDPKQTDHFHNDKFTITVPTPNFITFELLSQPKLYYLTTSPGQLIHTIIKDDTFIIQLWKKGIQDGKGGILGERKKVHEFQLRSTLAGGYKIGDEVYSATYLGDKTNKNKFVFAGMKGEVTGPATNGEYAQLNVKFKNCGQQDCQIVDWNLRPDRIQKEQTVMLPEGYNVGDKVFSLVDIKKKMVVCGMKGIVHGPVKNDETKLRVMFETPGGGWMVNMHSKEISRKEPCIITAKLNRCSKPTTADRVFKAEKENKQLGNEVKQKQEEVARLAAEFKSLQDAVQRPAVRPSEIRRRLGVSAHDRLRRRLAATPYEDLSPAEQVLKRFHAKQRKLPHIAALEKLLDKITSLP